MVKCIWKKKKKHRVRKHNLGCDMCCVNYIHGKMYKKKGNTRVRKHNLRGSEHERIGWFGMLGSISGWHMHY